MCRNNFLFCSGVSSYRMVASASDGSTMPSGACCLFWARWFSSAQPFDASRDTGASRAGAFAFVSPVIAVLLGPWRGDRAVEITGMTVLLSAAFLALREPENRSQAG
ncbi:exported hypothetical protein [Mesorhizobium plurifarium]|uniref:EamA domain-containing protein n=1 Tax=Mesorhizobium plurifarium TaxID=69974 RepID=A0A090EPM6_MESPL|nr:exported hypothetical protein [Mesorhizobium plurifarium]